MRTIFTAFGLITLSLAALSSGCSANTRSSFFEDDDEGIGGDSATNGTTGTSNMTTGGLGGGFDPTTVGSGGGSISTCNNPLSADGDGDGFTGNDGDCNDCDENVNPAAIDVIAGPDENGVTPDPADEDCDGTKDNVPMACDQGIDVADSDPMSGAKAVELCKVANGSKDWGVTAAKWVMADGSAPAGGPNFDLGHGILSAFGPNVNVQAGQRMLGLSSGTARQPTDPGYMSVGGFSKGYSGNHPQGFPKESPACPGVTTGTPYDPTALELTIRVPSNAQGFSFDFNFYTYEWPGFICSQYNDFFVALLQPFPMGQNDGNISFDSQGNPVSVNNAFLEICGCFSGPPCQAGGKTFTCALGNQGLIGTGFGQDSEGSDHASTGWLNTKAPVNPGSEIQIRWGVYDSGDGVLDSTTLVDNWKWIAEPGTTVGTVPIDTPN